MAESSPPSPAPLALPPCGFSCQLRRMDARVGRSFGMSCRHFGTGHSHAFAGGYLELVAHQRIRHTKRSTTPGGPA